MSDSSCMSLTQSSPQLSKLLFRREESRAVDRSGYKNFRQDLLDLPTFIQHFRWGGFITPTYAKRIKLVILISYQLNIWKEDFSYFNILSNKSFDSIWIFVLFLSLWNVEPLQTLFIFGMSLDYHLFNAVIMFSCKL